MLKHQQLGLLALLMHQPKKQQLDHRLLRQPMLNQLDHHHGKQITLLSPDQPMLKHQQLGLLALLMHQPKKQQLDHRLLRQPMLNQLDHHHGKQITLLSPDHIRL